ncbi:unnamed protein product [Haemonchus placei]|uniref:Large ribosomal subunit protein mL38 n=1 Tax=Haemonchus placei TaxID=6290 RepID=A0A0N4WPB6_HAEPC|nr:unnamed protein product [Haemonchus placei]
MSAKEYARLVPRAHRARRTPVIDRPMRPRMIAWAGPAAFYPNRFYEIDKWYKGRIDKPEQLPKLHIIDPANHLHSLSELLERQKPNITPIDMGFAQRPKRVSVAKTDEERAVLERKARKMECKRSRSIHYFQSLFTVLQHYGIFEHLFGPGIITLNYFSHFLKFCYKFSVYIYSKTFLKTFESVKIESVKPGEYNTLMMVNLDGNPYEKEGEVAHWVVANIPDGKSIDDGEELVPYLEPLPFCGTGYHRIVFILFRHEKPVNETLAGRIFSMSAMYKQNEDLITPSCATFFQTAYEISVKNRLHKMGLKSPIYEYQYNEALKPEQKEFPKKPQPFDLYMDMYRDPKEVEQELLEERLRRAQLDDYQAPKWLDPNYNENKKELPAWQHRRILAREGRYRALYNNALKS